MGKHGESFASALLITGNIKEPKKGGFFQHSLEDVL
jgi:hypothetical protein